jgi:monovalent cation:proton antiporter-2 (CPA2) family protein
VYTAYFIDIIILLVAAVIVVPVFQIARLGAVPGFLAAGVVVGPSGLGLISKVSEISHIAEIGVVLLLFIIGIELKPNRLWLMRRLVFGMGVLQVLLTGFLISTSVYYFFGMSPRVALLVGPTLALSSTAFVLQILAQQKLLSSNHGRASLAVLLLQDLAVVPLLALVPLLAMPELTIGQDVGIALAESLLILVLVVVVGRYFLNPILRRVALSGNPELFTASAVLIVLGAAVATERAGLSMAMGAFIAGLLISDSSYKHQVQAEILPFRGLLLGLFFMSMGMSVNLGLLFDQPIVYLGVATLLIALKVAILFPLALIFGLKRKYSTAVALLLAQSGEFAMVLFALAKQNSLLSEDLFQQLLLIVLLSMIATPVLAQIARRVAESERPPETGEDEDPSEAPVVLAGYGRVGHRIGEILQGAGIAFVALDCNPSVVAIARKKGQPVFYGDVCRPGILHAVGAAGPKVIIVTLNDPLSTKEVVASLNELYPATSIFARGHDLDVCRELSRLGASGVVSENVEASVVLARMTLVKMGLDETASEEILLEFQRRYKEQINNAGNGRNSAPVL